MTFQDMQVPLEVELYTALAAHCSMRFWQTLILSVFSDRIEQSTCFIRTAEEQALIMISRVHRFDLSFCSK